MLKDYQKQLREWKSGTEVPDVLHERVPNPTILFLRPSRSRQKLIDAFGRFGEVVDVHIPLDHVYKRVLGFAFVEMISREKAEEAMKELDNKPLDGR